VLHTEKKGMISRTVVASNIDSEGYLKNGDGPIPFADLYARTGVDLLIKKFNSAPSQWKCVSPMAVFPEKKQ
jgi:hypothetical protein